MTRWMCVRNSVLLLGLLGLVSPGVQGQAHGMMSGRVWSTVLDSAGEPVVGVKIQIPSVGAATLSDANGRFALGNVPVGRHEVVAELIGCLLGEAWIEVKAGERASLDFVVLEPLIRLPGRWWGSDEKRRSTPSPWDGWRSTAVVPPGRLRI